MFKNRDSKKLFNLKYYDIIILTIILFSSAIYSSTNMYLEMSRTISEVALEEALNFSEGDNWSAFISQSIYMALAIFYLYLRNFDFKRLIIKFKAKTPILAIGYFLIAALLMDLFFMLVSYASILIKPSVSETIFSNISVSLIIYALLNGFYEEFFFLGICMSVDKKYLPYSLIYSIIIRFSFHTYQGMISAIGIGLVFGLTFLFLYKKSKDKNLLPFFLAHAIADIIGLSILSYFYI